MDWRFNTIWYEQLPEGSFKSVDFNNRSKSPDDLLRSTYIWARRFKSKSGTLHDFPAENSVKYLEMSLDDLVRRLNGPTKVSISHVPAVVARLLRFVGPKLPGPLIDVMLNDCRSEHPTAHSVFGLSLTSLDSVWSRAG
jgi:hypothetical protein